MSVFSSPVFDDQIQDGGPGFFVGNISALVLDDSEVDRLRLKRMAQSTDLQIEFVEAATIAEFASKLNQRRFDIVFLDYRLVQGDGLIALEMLRRHPENAKSPSIMIAGEGQIQIAVDAMKSGCNDYLIKGNLTSSLLERSILHAIETSGLRQSLTAEEERRKAIQNSLGRFSASCGSEMRTILSAMLRRARGMRRNPGAISGDDVQSLETSCEKLWNFLDEFQEFVTDASAPQDKPGASRLLN